MAYVVATLPTRIDWLIVPTDRPKESFAVPVLTTIKEKQLILRALDKMCSQNPSGIHEADEAPGQSL